MKKYLLSIVTTLTLLTFIVIDAPAEIDSVLSVIPEDAVGLVYVPNLLGLNDEVNMLLAELVPTNPPQEIIAKRLAETFGAGFETLEELEELGFNLSKNFAVFLTDVNPPIPSAAVHLKDLEKVKQLIEMESPVESSVTYNGITYHTTAEEGAFVLLDDVMVYSGTPKVCEKAIDTYKNAMAAITTNADYTSLKLDTTSGINDLVAYVMMEPIVEAIRPRLIEAVDEMKAEMQEGAEIDPQLATSLGMVPKLIDGVLRLLDQSQSLSLSLQLNGSELQISPFLKFKSDSEIQAYIRQSPQELAQLKYLPQTAFFNGGMHFQSEDMIGLTTAMMKLFMPSDPNADDGQIEKALQEFTEAMTDFYEPLGDEASVSINLSDSLMPDIFLVNDARDEEKVKAYMEEGYLTYLEATQSLYQAMGAVEASGMYEGASAGPSEMYNGVEIKSYALPNIVSAFAELPPEMQGLAPLQWGFYYVVKGGKLILSMSGNAQPIKDALDLMAGTGAGFDTGAGYDRLTSALTLKNNMLIAISPITAAKSILQLVSQTDPNMGMMMMLLGNIPETYSIGIASENRESGVAGKLFISLGDFKDLINMAASLQGMQ